MRKKFDASFTVEAAFVFPIVVIITIAIIALGLFLYNKIKLESDMLLTKEQVRVFLKETDTEEAEKGAQAYAENLFGKGYLAAKATLAKLEVTSYSAMCDVNFETELSKVPFQIYPSEDLKKTGDMTVVKREDVARLMEIVDSHWLEK